jgi:c-di-AMP phosphodiesterase-like protein
MEKDITTRRTKFIQLEEKLQKSNEIFTALSLYNYDEVIENLQNELDQINEIGERSMQEARSECE